MSIFSKPVDTQLRLAGETWTTTLDGECESFYGIFDAENRLETDTAGMPVVIAGSVLTCKTSMAKRFAYNQQLTDPDGTIWYCRETLKESDGVLSRCSLTEKPA